MSISTDPLRNSFHFAAVDVRATELKHCCFTGCSVLDIALSTSRALAPLLPSGTLHSPGGADLSLPRALASMRCASVLLLSDLKFSALFSTGVGLFPVILTLLIQSCFVKI